MNMKTVRAAGAIIFYRTKYLMLAVFLVFSFIDSAAAQTCTPAPAGLVSWWPLDETSGTTAADIGDGNPGTHFNGPTPVSGKVAGALRFNGVDEYVDAGTTGFPIGNSSRTMDAWVRTTSSGFSFIVTYGTMTTNQGSFIYLQGGTMRAGFFSNDVDSGIAINDGTWHLLAFTFDGSTMRTYVDGAPGNTKSTTTNTGGGIFRIGARNDSIIFLFDGEIDEVEIFNRDLSQAEIQAIFDANNEGKCKPLNLGILDHFKCYKAKDDERFFERQIVLLSDQFEEKLTVVKEPELVCNPVDKNGEGINDPAAHLVCYRIRDVRGEPEFEAREVVTENQFGELLLEVEEPELLCVPSLKTDLGPIADDDDRGHDR